MTDNSQGNRVTNDRRAYHRAYCWAHLVRRREQAREAHFRRQLRKWFGDEMPASLKRLLRRTLR
jgi:hypothetical protein